MTFKINMIYLQRTQVFRLPSRHFFPWVLFYFIQKGLNYLKKFYEKYKNLLKSEGFTIQNQTEHNTEYFRSDGITINIAKKDKDYIIVTSTLSKDEIKYTTTISHADPSGIFELLIIRFHEKNMYQNT